MKAININQSRQENQQRSGNKLGLAGDNKIIQLKPSGTSGTDISGGRFFEEYLNALHMTEAADIWDEMRRCDDQIAMLLRVVKNPIMSASWFISPPDESDEEKNIADFINYLLFEDMGTEQNPRTFEKFKREALTAIEFGYSLFEIVHKIVYNHNDYGNYIGINGLNWRSQRTIEEWNISRHGELIAIHQLDNSERATDIWMDGRFLLHISPEMEGDNFEGISMLRPIYGNYIRKDLLRKLQIIGIERGATGVPIGEVPIGQENSPAQILLEEGMSRFVGHERSYLLTSAGWKIDSLKIEHDAEKVQSAIEAENVGMAKSFLANFMELGLNGTGSYALGTDLSDIFLSGIEVYANSVLVPINRRLIPHLVRANFGKRKKYPCLQIEGINDKAGKEFAEVLGILKTNDLLRASEKLIEVIHRRYKLPYELMENDKAEPKPEPEEKQLMEIDLFLSEKDPGKKIEIWSKKAFEKMQAAYMFRAKTMIDKLIRIWKNEIPSKRMKSANQVQVPEANKYKGIVKALLAEIYVDSTEDVIVELGGKGMKLAEPDPEKIRELTPEAKATLQSQAELLTESQDADLRKNMLFSFTSSADKLPTSEQMEAQLLKTADAYLNSASFMVSAPNAVANAVNLARNAIYQKKNVLDKIESFVFMNEAPVSAICKHLKGRVFTKAEYITSPNLPPLHHNCKSWIKAQIISKNGNIPISSSGLSIQGSDSEINNILKSASFGAGLGGIPANLIKKQVASATIGTFKNYDEMLKYQQENWIPLLNKDEISAINDYTRGDFKAIRALQAGDTKKLNIFREAYKEKDFDIIETNFTKALNKDGRYEGIIYRGIHFDSKSDLNNFLKNKKIVLDADASASISQKIANEFASQGQINVILKIKSKSAISIENLSSFRQEQELILRKGSKYAVGKKIAKGNMMTVELIEI